MATANKFNVNGVSIDLEVATPKETPASASSYVIGYDKLTSLGTLTGTIAISFETLPSDGNAHIYDFIFTCGSTAPTVTITLPTGGMWLGGSAPTFSASKTYEISVSEGLAVCGEFSAS